MNEDVLKNLKVVIKYLLFIYLFINIAYAKSNEIKPTLILVCSTCEIKSIQVALDAIAENGTVRVLKGKYENIELKVLKSLKLIGESGTVLDGGGKFQVITVIHADNVSIENFNIQNTGASFTAELAGIRVIESKNCSIKNNNFHNTTYGIYLEKSENCIVQKNSFESYAKDETSSGNGIHMWTGASHKILDNEIQGHRDGIYLEFVKGGFISNNNVHHNLRYGLHFMSSNETTYSENTFSSNGAGVAVMYSRKIKMFKNSFTHNLGASSYGLLLKEIVESEISQNLISANTVGIYMEGSNRSLFKNNQISQNGFGLKIMGDCENNEFTHNNFLQNTFEVMTNANHSWNSFSENYWSQYSGYDFNKDGFGDKPHRPVSLSSFILEKVDSAYILLNSFFFQVLDEVERAFPEMIPEQLKDDKPKMERELFNVKNS